jgi:DedD protein
MTGLLNIMDRRLKERLVGATILVVLIVLIVPELLSGPRRPLPTPAVTGGAVEAVRNVTVDLATSKATAASDSSVSAPASESPPPIESPPPRADSPPPADGDRSEDATTPELHTGHGSPPSITTLKAQQPQGAAVENPSAPPISAGVRARSNAAGETAASPQEPHPFWAVQTGSFASRANAEKQMHRLKSHESSVYLSSGGRGPALRYRVRVGPFADRAAAERAKARLKQEGESASLVAP